MGLRRRDFLRSGAVAAGVLGLGTAYWRATLGAESALSAAGGPYGELGAADANGIMLPSGFTSRRVALGDAVVPGTSYRWHRQSDGQATYATPDGGWIVVSNSETSSGGASAIRFGPGGEIVSAGRILGGTVNNCSGGATPWGTWLSCEEHDEGAVWECDPTGASAAIRRPALGIFSHESAAVDPAGQRVYLTEDEGDGGLYRFTPASYPDLSVGLLEVAVDAGEGRLGWAAVPDPTARSAPTRDQVPQMRVFERGEGLWLDSGVVYVATTADDRVWAHDIAAGTIEAFYDAETHPQPAITDPDNICVSASGDLFCCEDSGNLEIVLVTPQREVAPFLRLTGPEHADTETCGVVFDPSGWRMYFASQEAHGGAGAVYEVTGPFRGAAGPAPVPFATASPTPSPTATQPAPPSAAQERSSPVGPALGVEAARRIRLRTLRRRGLAYALTLDSRAEVVVVLRARLRPPGARRARMVTLSREARRLERGMHHLDAELSRGGRAALRGRTQPLRAELVIEVRRAGRTSQVRRVVRILG